MDLAKVTSKMIKPFSLESRKQTRAKVMSIESGNLCDVLFERNGELVRFPCYLFGYEAPTVEERPKAGKLAAEYLGTLCRGESRKDFDDSRTLAQNDLQWLLDQNDHLVYAKFGKFDEAGRVLVTLKATPRARKSINDLMSEYVKDLQNLSESSDMSQATSEESR